MITQKDKDRRNAIYAELMGQPVSIIESKSDWMDKHLAAHRIAAEKAVLQNGVNCPSCGVRLPKDYEKQCPDCGFPHIPANAFDNILEQQP